MVLGIFFMIVDVLILVGNIKCSFFVNIFLLCIMCCMKLVKVMFFGVCIGKCVFFSIVRICLN